MQLASATKGGTPTISKIVDDAFGNFESSALAAYSDLAEINPFRYRGYYYDLDTGLYYLQSRYYDLNTGRFISADTSYVSTGQGLIGNNMFAYCLNNPILYIDVFGDTAVSFIEKFKNKDGTYSLYDNDRFEDEGAFHNQLLSINISSPSCNLAEDDKLGLGSVSADLITGGWEWKYVDLSLVDFGHFEANAVIEDGQLKLGAMASVWSPSVEFHIGKIDVEISLEVFAIGAGVDAGKNGVSMGLAFGFGFWINIDW